MIKTRNLIGFMKDKNVAIIIDAPVGKEYRAEIITRLRAFDKLKDSIEKLCRHLSNGVDK